MSILGYTTASEAKSIGCTHHASYYGIPLWMGDVDSDAPLAFAKWLPLDYLMPVFSYIEGICNCLLGNEPTFMFKIGREIE